MTITERVLYEGLQRALIAAVADASDLAELLGELNALERQYLDWAREVVGT